MTTPLRIQDGGPHHHNPRPPGSTGQNREPDQERAPRRRDIARPGDRGRWVLDHCRRELEKNPGTTLAVLDCVRNEAQLLHIRAEWPGPLLHLHLTASPETLAARYRERGDPSPMSQAQGHPAERGIAQLGDSAPLAISAVLAASAGRGCEDGAVGAGGHGSAD